MFGKKGVFTFNTLTLLYKSQRNSKPIVSCQKNVRPQEIFSLRRIRHSQFLIPLLTRNVSLTLYDFIVGDYSFLATTKQQKGKHGENYEIIPEFRENRKRISSPI